MQSIHAIFFSDTHLGYDSPLKPRTKRKRRGDDFFSNLRIVVDEILNSKPDFAIHGGDVFDHPYIHKSIIDKAFLSLFEIADAGIPLFIVPGNHERGNLPSSLFMQHPNIHIFEEAKTFRIYCKDELVSVSGFPYYYGGIRKDFQALQNELIHDTSPNGLNIMCLHHVIEGAEIKNYTFRTNPDVIKINELNDIYACFLSGHIHRYQLLRNPFNNVPFLYPGSTERTSYQEADEAKGYCRLNFEKVQSKFVFSHEFIELPARQLETLKFESRIYSEDEVRKLLTEKVNSISPDSVLRFQSEFVENIYKITRKIENEIIPDSICIHRAYPGTRRKKSS